MRFWRAAILVAFSATVSFRAAEAARNPHRKNAGDASHGAVLGMTQDLYKAAAAGDRAQFEAALDTARSTADSMPVGDARNRLRHAVIVATDLDRIWKFDGLYWDEESLPDYYDRLSSEYPDFERFIAGYRVIDATGRVFYPKQETRQFLVRHLVPSPNSRKRST